MRGSRAEERHQDYSSSVVHDNGLEGILKGMAWLGGIKTVDVSGG